MKTQLKLILLLIAVSFIVFPACKKRRSYATTIVQISTKVDKNNTETGTFTASGGINTSGHFVMEVKYVGTDSFHCTNKLSAQEGTFTTDMKCSMITNTGEWNIINGTGKYAHMSGGGSLVMSYPPDVVGVETLTGYVSPED